MNKIKKWIRLLSAPEIGNSKAIKLVEILGEPANFIGTSNRELMDLDFIPGNTKEYLKEDKDPKDWKRVVALIEKYQIEFITYFDDDYPTILKNIFDPPAYLFYRGTIRKEDFRRSLAIVGTRKASSYGKAMTKKIGEALSQAGFTIVSGLAYGIDALAHIAALNSGGRTIAVMGTGVDQIYPPHNRELAEDIIKNGAIISEYIPGSKAEKWNFPTRNRMISGLCLGSLIIEGSKKSGALLTSKFAMDQNRDVFALPGDINRPQAEGPNYLIKLGAKIVCSAKDILEEYDLIMEEEPKLFPELSEKEEKIYQVLIDNRPETHFDTLLMKTGFTVGELSTILLSLELKNIVKKVPGNKIVPMY